MEAEDKPLRIWEFAGCEFDEAYRELRVKKKRVELEAKPLQVLYTLLLRNNEVVTHAEFFEAVWPEQLKSESLLRSLFAAVSRLRKFLPEQDPPVILTIHGVGYRLTPAITIHLAESGPRNTLNLKIGDEIPGRSKWIIEEQLTRSRASEVWLARREKTGEARVFKFALTASQLDGLRREVTVSRWFRKALPFTHTFVEVEDWNFEQEPFFLESAYGGPSLDTWAKAQGGLEQVPLAVRLGILSQVASAVAAAHDLGVLHKDLKPGNILIDQISRERNTGDASQAIQIRIADFGSATLADPERLRDFDITNEGFEAAAAANSRGAGTWTYTAPEVREGGVATTAADVYALGVMLYQIVIGDFTRQLTVGWEAEVPDPLLREDIALAASGDPAKRFLKASELAGRLAHLEDRRIQLRDTDEALRHAAMLENAEMRRRARRPLAMAAAAILITGICVSLWFYRSAALERDRANARNAESAAMIRFLTEDLLAQGNPFGGKAQAKISLLAAIQSAAGEIDHRFSGQPLIAGRLHFAIANALGSNDDLAGADQGYEMAAQDFERAGGKASPDAAVARLREAYTDAHSTVLGGIDRGGRILQAEKQVLAAHSLHSHEIDTLVLATQATIEAQTENLPAAFKDSQAAVALSPDDDLRMAMLRLTGFVAMRMGNGPALESSSRELIQQISASQGPASPALLNPRMQLMESFFIQRKFREAVGMAEKTYPDFVRQAGQHNQTTFQVLATKAAAEMSLGRLDAAIQDDLLVQKLAYEWNPHSAFAIGPLADVAASEKKKSDWPACERYARKGWTLIEKEPHPVRGLQDGIGEMLAACLLQSGDERNAAKLNEAEQLLKRMDIAAVTSVSGDAGVAGDVAMMLGEIALARGQRPEARRYADQATERYRAVTPPDPDRLRELNKLKQGLAG